MIEFTFHCVRRDMPVMKDTSDCQGCPLRVHPTPCTQFAFWEKKLKAGELSFVSDYFTEPKAVDDYQPYEPDITE